MAKLVFGYNFGKLSVAIVKTVGQKLDKGDWTTIDPDSLSPELQQAYSELREARKLANEVRAKFEAMMTKEVGLEPEAKPEPKAKKALSLADYIAAQQ